MRISPEIIQSKLDTVPEDVREQVTSDEVAQTPVEIGKAHALHIDKQGILDEETLYIMLGIENPNSFVDKLRSRLGIDEGKAISIARDINEKIFLRIRRSLMDMHEIEKASEVPEPPASQVPIPAPMPRPEPAVTEKLSSREDILADIENPPPTIHPISSADQTIPGPAIKKEITLEDEVAAKNFVSGKLSGTVYVRPQKAVFEDKKPEEKPKSYPADPYREPIM